jgi:hypothetical protein
VLLRDIGFKLYVVRSFRSFDSRADLCPDLDYRSEEIKPTIFEWTHKINRRKKYALW